MKYKIEFVENKTGKSGKPYKMVALTDETGKYTKDASTFDEVLLGETYEGELIQNGQFLNFKLAGEKTTTGIKVAQERKAEYIKEAQERKNESIAYFNAVNSAISLAEIMWPDMPGVDAKSFLTEWRDWFLEEWQKYETKDYQDKHQPF